MPALRIARVRIWAHPEGGGLHREVLQCEVLCPAITIDKGAARSRFSGSVSTTKPVQHQLAPIIELYAEPIPSDEILSQVRRAELVVHPTGSSDLELLVSDRQGADRGESGERVVVGCLSQLGPFPTDATDTMHDKRLLRRQRELESDGVGRCAKLLGEGDRKR